ncbi:MAG: transposase [Lachnospiraceae bacterium]|nr:transposase [Lachnospiraceae bacterium]
MKRKSETQKILAVRDYRKGKKIADICREYNCAKSTFYTWVRPYTEKKNKYGTVRLKDLQLANDRIRKLENELEIIHNSSFFKELTLKDKVTEGYDQNPVFYDSDYKRIEFTLHVYLPEKECKRIAQNGEWVEIPKGQRLESAIDSVPAQYVIE